MRLARTRPDFSRRYVVYVHYAYNVIFSIATTLKIRIKLVSQSVMDAVPKEGRMYANFSFEIAEEEHCSGSPKLGLRSTHCSRAVLVEGWGLASLVTSIHRLPEPLEYCFPLLMQASPAR